MTDKADALLEGRLAVLARQHNVGSRELVDASGRSFNAASVLVQEPGGGFAILSRKDVSPPVRLFSQLHEIGHIALGYVYGNPQEAHDLANEAEINLWALDRIRTLITHDLYKTLRDRFLVDEEAAFRMIREQLMQDIDRNSRKKICVNPDLVHRENDQSLFDFEAFKLYRFNETGHRLLKEIVTPIPYFEFIEKAESLRFPNDDVDEFVKGCVEAKLIHILDEAETA